MFVRIIISPANSKELRISKMALDIDSKALVAGLSKTINQSNITFERNIKEHKAYIKMNGLSFQSQAILQKFRDEHLTHLMKTLGLYTLYQLDAVEFLNKSEKVIYHTQAPEEKTVTEVKSKTLPKTVTDLIKPEESGQPQDQQLELALRRAAASKNSTYLAGFIQSVKNINAQDETPGKNKTALHWAIEKERIDNFKLLTAFGAKLYIKDASGKSPYDLLCESKNDTFAVIPQKYKNIITFSPEVRNPDTNFVIRIISALEQVRLDVSKGKKLDFLLANNITILIKYDKKLVVYGEFSRLPNDPYTTYITINQESIGQDDELLIRTLRHEIEHAYKYWIHLKKDNVAQQKYDVSLFNRSGHFLPFFPFVTDEKTKFTKLITQGDERLILSIHPLFNKKQQGIVLSSTEQASFERISAALVKYKPRLEKYLIESELAQELKEDSELKDLVNSRAIKLRVTAKNNNRAPFFITQILDDDHMLGYHAMNLSDPVEKGLCLAYEIMMRDFIKAHDYDLSCESHARTVGELPTEIIEMFYPELVAYDNEDSRVDNKLPSLGSHC